MTAFVSVLLGLLAIAIVFILCVLAQRLLLKRLSPRTSAYLFLAGCVITLLTTAVYSRKTPLPKALYAGADSARYHTRCRGFPETVIRSRPHYPELTLSGETRLVPWGIGIDVFFWYLVLAFIALSLKPKTHPHLLHHGPTEPSSEPDQKPGSDQASDGS